jgi:hypothetical protein
MTHVPGVTPVTMPVEEPTVAQPGAPETHVPPGVALLSVWVLPTHTVNVPVIGAKDPASLMVIDVLREISPDVAPLLFTAFMVTKNFTLPVPVAGAVHGTNIS